MLSIYLYRGYISVYVHEIRWPYGRCYNRHVIILDTINLTSSSQLVGYLSYTCLIIQPETSTKYRRQNWSHITDQTIGICSDSVIVFDVYILSLSPCSNLAMPVDTMMIWVYLSHRLARYSSNICFMADWFKSDIEHICHSHPKYWYPQCASWHCYETCYFTYQGSTMLWVNCIKREIEHHWYK